MEAEPPKKKFRIVPFSVHVTRGVLRDARARRKVMGVSLVFAVAMLAAGLTILRPLLDPHEHPWRFILYWLACAWGTLLVILLALFDLLLIRAEARAAQRVMRKKFAEETESKSAGDREE